VRRTATIKTEDEIQLLKGKIGLCDLVAYDQATSDRFGKRRERFPNRCEDRFQIGSRMDCQIHRPDERQKANIARRRY
jgi:hypothetical protein